MFWYMIESFGVVSNPDYCQPQVAKDEAMSQTRNSVLDGTWYPADPAALTAQVDAYLAGADSAQRPTGRPLVAVVPHAGYVYSGATAGRLYGLLAQTPPRRVFILAPNHRVALTRVALSGADVFDTPLGPVPVDTAVSARLAAHPEFSVDDHAHAQEHAIEIQLPLLQRTWPAAVPTIVPLLVPRLNQEAAGAVSRALAAACDDTSLLVVSTDFTHFGDRFGFQPFRQNIPAALEQLDAGAFLKILAADAAGLRAYGQQTGITMCGLEAAAVALDCGLPASYEGALLDYSRSGDRDGDYSTSVSYAAVLLCSGPTAND